MFRIDELNCPRPALWLFLLFLAGACDAPPSASPPSDRDNPPPLTAECDFVAKQLGQREYYWIRMGGGDVCINRIEQDECVLSIAESCHNRTLQWTGKIDASHNIQFWNVGPGNGPELAYCEGRLNFDEVESIRSTRETAKVVRGGMLCEGTMADNIFIESVLPSSLTVEPDPSKRIVKNTSVVRTTDLMRDAVIVNDTELWAVFAGIFIGKNDAAVYIYSLTSLGGFEQLDLPKLTNLSWSKTSSVVLAAADRSVLKIDIATRAITELISLDGPVDELAVTPDGRAFYVTYTSSATPPNLVLERRPVAEATKVEARRELPLQAVAKTLVPPSTSAEVPAFLAYTALPTSLPFFTDHRLLSFTWDLEPIEELSFDFVLSDLVLMEDRKRIGFLKRQDSRYFEMNFSGEVTSSTVVVNEELQMLPMMKTPAALTYVPEQKRMYIGGFRPTIATKDDGIIGILDLETGRMVPDTILLKDVHFGFFESAKAPMEMVYNGSTKRLYPVIKNQAYLWEVDWD